VQAGSNLLNEYLWEHIFPRFKNKSEALAIAVLKHAYELKCLLTKSDIAPLSPFIDDQTVEMLTNEIATIGVAAFFDQEQRTTDWNGNEPSHFMQFLDQAYRWAAKVLNNSVAVIVIWELYYWQSICP
jgi:hypothetical protein